MTSDANEWRWLINSARTKLPGAADAAIKQEANEVVREFAFETSTMIENLTITLTPSVTSYPLTPTEPGDIIRLGGAINSNGDPQPVSMPVLGSLQLRDTPTTAQTWTVMLIKQPSINVGKTGESSLPDGYLVVYGQPILWGLLGAMMGHINKPYSSGQMALYWLRKYRGAMTTARAAVLHQRTFGVNAWRFPSGFASRGQRGGVSVGTTSPNQFFG